MAEGTHRGISWIGKAWREIPPNVWVGAVSEQGGYGEIAAMIIPHLSATLANLVKALPHHQTVMNSDYVRLIVDHTGWQWSPKESRNSTDLPLRPLSYDSTEQLSRFICCSTANNQILQCTQIRVTGIAFCLHETT